MDNSIVLELIKKDLDELQILVEALQKDEHPNQLLIDITIGRTKTLLQEFSLLQGVETSLPSKETVKVMEEAKVQILPGEPEHAIETESEEKLIVDQQGPAAAVLNEQIKLEEEAEQEVPSSIEAIQENEPAEVSTEEFFFEEKVEDEEVYEEMPDEVTEVEEALVEQETIIESPTTEDETKDEKLAETEPTVQTETVQEIEDEEHELAMELKVEGKKILGEQFVKEPILNERLSSGTLQESKIKGKPVTSLRKAIGLNDKFMFTRELFGNDHGKFDRSITDLDQCNNLLEAIDYLEKNFKWTKSETSLKFIALLKQRFSN